MLEGYGRCHEGSGIDFVKVTLGSKRLVRPNWTAKLSNVTDTPALVVIRNESTGYSHLWSVLRIPPKTGTFLKTQKAV